MLLPLFVSTYSFPPQERDTKECVVLLHGIFTTSLRMSRIHHRLHKEGFTVVSITYPSRHVRIREIAEHIAPLISGFEKKYQKIHMVGYSMGGLIARAYLARDDAIQVTRLVCVGTPNQGTEYIDEMRRSTRLKRWFAFIGGPSGNELGTAHELDSIVRELGSESPHGVETGIIAGNARWSVVPRLPRPHDGYVPVESTKLSGMQDFAVMPYGHIHLPFRTRVVDAVVSFLKYGRFSVEK